MEVLSSLIKESKPFKEDSTYDTQSFEAGNIELEEPMAALIPIMKTMLPLHRNAAGLVDISPLIHSFSVQIGVNALSVANHFIPASQGHIFPLPSQYRTSSPLWCLGRRFQDTAEFVALVALTPCKLKVFAFDEETRSKWINMTYGGDAILFQGKTDITQLNFVRSVSAVMDEHAKDHAQVTDMGIGDIMICHAAMPWKIEGDENTLYQCVHFGLKMNASLWQTAWEQKGFINADLVKHLGSTKNMKECEEPRTPVTETFTPPPWVKISSTNLFADFEAKRDELLSKDASAWNPDWEQTARGHAEKGNMKAFKTAMKTLMERISNMTEQLPFLKEQRDALSIVRTILDDVPNEVRVGNANKSWGALNRKHKEHLEKMINWVYAKTPKGTQLLAETTAFARKYALRVQLKPFMLTPLTPVMTGSKEAKKMLSQAYNLLEKISKHPLLAKADQNIRDSMLVVKSTLQHIGHAVRADSTPLYDVAPCDACMKYLLTCEAIFKAYDDMTEVAAEAKDASDGEEAMEVSDEDEEDDGEYEDEEEEEEEEEDDPRMVERYKHLHVLIPSFYDGEHPFDPTKKDTKRCPQCERKGIVYLDYEQCIFCIAKKLKECAHDAISVSQNAGIPAEHRTEVKRICGIINKELLSAAAEMEKNKDSKTVTLSKDLFKWVDQLVPIAGQGFVEDDPEHEDDAMDQDENDLVDPDDHVEYEEGYGSSSSSEETPKNRKRGRDDDSERNEVAHALVMAMIHTPVASTIKPLLPAYRNGKYDVIRNATGMLRTLPVLYALQNKKSRMYTEMFTTEEDAEKACTDPAYEVVPIEKDDHWK